MAAPRQYTVLTISPLQKNGAGAPWANRPRGTQAGVQTARGLPHTPLVAPADQKTQTATSALMHLSNPPVTPTQAGHSSTGYQLPTDRPTNKTQHTCRVRRASLICVLCATAVHAKSGRRKLPAAAGFAAVQMPARRITQISLPAHALLHSSLRQAGVPRGLVRQSPGHCCQQVPADCPSRHQRPPAVTSSSSRQQQAAAAFMMSHWGVCDNSRHCPAPMQQGRDAPPAKLLRAGVQLPALQQASWGAQEHAGLADACSVSSLFRGLGFKGVVLVHEPAHNAASRPPTPTNPSPASDCPRCRQLT